MSLANNLTSANTQPFPDLGAEFVDENRFLARPWYRLLISLWKRTGGGFLNSSNSVYIGQAPVGSGAPLAAYDSNTGKLIGMLYLKNVAGAPAIVLNLISNPFTFTAGGDGTLIVFGGKTEISRDLGATFYPTSLVGGAIPVLIKDKIRITWFGAVAPQTVFLPIV
jgi:hypothetical protein